MRWRENFPLFAGILIPVVMVVVIAASIYLPQVLSRQEKPEYSFLYMTGDNTFIKDGVETDFFVEGGKLQKTETELPKKESPGMVFEEPTFYVYNVAEHASEKISFEDAAKLSLSTSSVSPDGFELVSSQGGFPFETYDAGAKFLKGKNYHEKIHLEQDTRSYRGSQFLGWVLPRT
ncbi:MAG TPA: hypothetical protein VFM02_01625 [Candidatus Paceibacterota bacterium]|nr:hypothetical protein [Candidatus Paceibacterota bacterium]